MNKEDSQQNVSQDAPQNLNTNHQNPTAHSHNFVLAAVGFLIVVLIAAILIILSRNVIFSENKKVSQNGYPSDMDSRIRAHTQDQTGSETHAQKEVSASTEDTALSYDNVQPYSTDQLVNGLSSFTTASEQGKKYSVLFSSQAQKNIELLVTVKRAAKYYPVKQGNNYFIYMPTCSALFEAQCFTGTTFPIEVQNNQAIISADIEIKNSTADQTFYIKGGAVRYRVGDTYLPVYGGYVGENISTNQTQRFSNPDDFYSEPLTSKTTTYYILVPNTLQEAELIYGSNLKDPNYRIDFHFKK